MIEVKSPARIVVVGPNGAGKTRLGVWLEGNNEGLMRVHRISAQRALDIPDFAQVKNLEQAERDLYYGRADQYGIPSNRFAHRWGGRPYTHLLSDYDKLLSLLFAKAAERDRLYTQRARTDRAFSEVPDSVIDQINAIWGYLMPQRTITFLDGKVLVNYGAPNQYHGMDMSDGERVTLYLIGQCLLAPDGSLVIIDEPELHLHRSLIDKFWNKVEELCPNKSIVYITHDLEFAASRADARKFWIQRFESEGAWHWSELPSDDTLPENLILELIGNRKPVLFCEGERGGIDQSIYQLCFPGYHVIPRGSSEKVIESVKAFTANSALHFVKASGIIDRDVRTDDELASLSQHSVHAITFAEIENLLCNEELIRAVACNQAHNPDQIVESVTAYVSNALSQELEAQIVMRATREVHYHLSRFSHATKDRDSLRRGVDEVLQSLNLDAKIQGAETALRGALAQKNLDNLLKLYNRKTLADRISPCFGLQNGEYMNLVLRLLKSKDSPQFVQAIKRHLPALS